ncbi:type I restriction enzyme R subunit [Mycobacterium frederiksbergense]|uniref:Type I restriction enzyme R subunit n=1 Tax=Mycolicibacterium frederiksbergense TaxID=117567 RepID=A0ABT6L854_9MYCO|nr:DEAD/DEAH box helicase family protein [Mycolicibacterium frederiksbergense]MDH6199084.1 type I restriction enzyme R subunit [Mycolicibacterium frederiksbergense]
MGEPDKLQLTETEIRTRFVTPALSAAGWPLDSLREEFFYFSAGRIQVVGKKGVRKKPKRVDYLLEYRPNLPVAVVEAKDNRHAPGHGMQQAIQYAEQLDVPSVFTTNGDSFVWHDRTGLRHDVEQVIALDDFPSPEVLYDLYKRWRGITDKEDAVTSTKFHDDGTGRRPRYYQRIAINRTLESIAAGDKRLLLVMATGTGKTYTAAQIIWRFMGAFKKLNPTKSQPRVLFLADRNILIDQTMLNDFSMYKGRMAKLSTSHKTITKLTGEVPELGINAGKVIDKSYEVYLSLYQAVSGSEDIQNIYKQFSPDFFDLVIVDECHRGSARADSAWREILEYFCSSTQIGLTATPKETKTVSNIDYFGEPIYTYSLRQGIEDGYLAPYKVIRVATDVDTFGYRPTAGEVDDSGELIPQKNYDQNDFDRTLVLPERDKRVAERIAEYLKNTDRFAKTIVFCVDIDHANRMRRALSNLNKDEVNIDSRYVMQITGDDQEGKAELDNFIDPESRYPVIATTSKLLSTGVDAQTCKVIVLDSKIESMTDFKQMIGRGTRVRTDYDKWFFVILDFRNVTKLFADPDFDGDPVKIVELPPAGDMDEAVDDLDEIDETETGAEGEAGPDEWVEMPEDRTAKRKKLIVSGQAVTIIGERVQLLGADGKLVTESLKDFTRRNVLGEYATLDDFLTAWTSADRRSVLLDEMAEKGIPIDDLLEQVGADLDPFDLILHVAYDLRPMRRRDRAAAVRASNYLSKYQGMARQVIEALLDKYADSGLRTVEDVGVLRVDPFRNMGTPMEIIKHFGSRETFENAIRDLERELYQEAA